MKSSKPFPVPVRAKIKYSCEKCPAYCCTYSDIEITRADIARLGRHFEMGYDEAEARFTKPDATKTVRLLRHKADKHFNTACALLDQETRRCTVYHARPGVCRKYPDNQRCGYYDFLAFEREQQGDEAFIATT